MTPTRTLTTGLALGALVSMFVAPACHSSAGPANTKITCDAIHTAIRAGTLDDHAAETEIKIDASRPGVPDSIGNAADTYYRGDHDGGRQAMLVACADAGYPA